MTKQEALETLDSMQSQIIGGSSIFGDIADVIRRQENVDSAYVAQAMDYIIKETQWAGHFPEQCLDRIRKTCKAVKAGLPQLPPNKSL